MTYRNAYTVQAIVVLALVLIFSSCSDLIIQQTDEEHLTFGSWEVESVISEPPIVESESTDQIGFEENCKQDDILNFNQDGTYYISDNINLCKEQPSIKEGRWQITTNDSKKSIEFLNKESLKTYTLQSVSRYALVVQQYWTKTGRTETTTYLNTRFEN